MYWCAISEIKFFIECTDIEQGSMCSEARRALMTREEILRQMATLQTQLDELDKAQGFAYMSISLTEAEKEKQHQEDLQRLS